MSTFLEVYYQQSWDTARRMQKELHRLIHGDTEMKDYRWLNLGPIKAKMYHNWKPDAVLINYGMTGPVLTGTMIRGGSGGGAVVTDEKVEVDSTPLPDRGSAALQPHYIPVCRVYLLEETDPACPTCEHGALKGQWTCEGKAILYRCTYCGRHFMTMDRG